MQIGQRHPSDSHILQQVTVYRPDLEPGVRGSSNPASDRDRKLHISTLLTHQLELRLMETLVHTCPSVRVLDYCCAGHGRGQGPEEEVGAYEVVLPREGIFIRHVRGESIVADPNHALFFNSGESYRVSHPVSGGDRCTVLSFATSQIEDCLLHLDPHALSSGTRLFRSTHTPTSPALDLLHRQLLRIAESTDESLAVEEIAIDLLAGLINASMHAPVSEYRVSQRATTTQRHNDLIMAVREELARRLGDKLDLRDIASAVHVSPFHLCRVFRSRTGISLSGYHRRLRLRTALQRILDGEDDLTQLAISLGFSHHSHFTNAFSREFGIPPSTNREHLNIAELRTAAAAIRYRVTRLRMKKSI